MRINGWMREKVREKEQAQQSSFQCASGEFTSKTCCACARYVFKFYNRFIELAFKSTEPWQYRKPQTS